MGACASEMAFIAHNPPPIKFVKHILTKKYEFFNLKVSEIRGLAAKSESISTKEKLLLLMTLERNAEKSRVMFGRSAEKAKWEEIKIYKMGL